MYATIYSPVQSEVKCFMKYAGVRFQIKSLLVSMSFYINAVIQEPKYACSGVVTVSHIIYQIDMQPYL